MKLSRLALLAAMSGLAAAARAQDDDPDLSFLEYLGSWQESDEEWLIVADMEQEEPAEAHEASAEDGTSAKGKDADETDDTDDADEK
jgi:hypothetical protein